MATWPPHVTMLAMVSISFIVMMTAPWGALSRPYLSLPESLFSWRRSGLASVHLAAAPSMVGLFSPSAAGFSPSAAGFFSPAAALALDAGASPVGVKLDWAAGSAAVGVWPSPAAGWAGWAGWGGWAACAGCAPPMTCIVRMYSPSIWRTGTAMRMLAWSRTALAWMGVKVGARRSWVATGLLPLVGVPCCWPCCWPCWIWRLNSPRLRRLSAIYMTETWVDLLGIWTTVTCWFRSGVTAARLETTE